MLRIIIVALLLAAVHAGSSQVAFTGSYSQDFNSLGPSGTSMPEGWSHHGALGGDNDTWTSAIPTSGAISAASAGTVNNALIVSTGTSGTSNTQAFNFGAAGSSERALGTSPTSGAGNILQLRLTNSTGAELSFLVASYDIVRYTAASSANELPGYWIFVSTDNGSTWTELIDLRPTSATVPNSAGITSLGPVLLTLPEAVAAGGEIRLRWVDDNADQTSPDQRIGLDNLLITAADNDCPAPSDLTASAITDNAAELTWAAVPGATAYDLQWRPLGAPAFTLVSGLTGTACSLSGLTPGTTYEFRVRSLCGTTPSPYSAAYAFSTTGSVPMEVIHIWSGAIQPTSATVVAKLSGASATCRAVVSTSPSLSDPIFSAFATASSSNNFMAKMDIVGLSPGTTYYYAVESGGVVDASADDIGSFRTPEEGPFSYTFTVGSCSGTGNHGVFTAMLNKNPLFFLQTGDMHYEDPNSANINAHRTPYENIILSQAPSRDLLKSTALAYMWDDHDYCGNNNSGPSLTGTANARQAYREYVPHYPIAAGSGNNPIYQAFTIGRIHFILSDLRSVRSSGTMFGATQKEWFKQQCLYARDNCLMIAWVTGTSLGGTQSDNWGGFNAERVELSNWFRDNGIENMFILSGDAHMVAIDNGSNHDFSTGSNNPHDYPVFAAAALNRSGSDKGGIYSQGKFPNPNSSTGQYGVVEVTDNGGPTLSIAFKGYRTSGNSAIDAIISSYSFTRTVCLTTGMQRPTAFAVREAEEGRAVQLAWDDHGQRPWLVVERQDDERRTATLLANAPSRGELRDNSPVSGWNHYRLMDANGNILAVKSIYAKAHATISVFPNPANDHFTVDLGGLKGAINGHWILYDAMRRAVVSDRIVLAPGDRRFSIHVADLQPGSYLAYLYLNGMTVTERIVVSR